MQNQMKMFGSMDQILGMIPGINIAKDDRQKISHLSEKQFKKIEVIIQSMTPCERNNPDLINTSRKKRLAKGTGMTMQEINQFMTQFNQMRAVMKSMSDMKGLAGKLNGAGNIGSLAGLGGFKGKMGKHALNKAMARMRRFK